MIGAVIQGIGLGESQFNPIIYHKFGARSVLDMTIDSCLLAPQLHKVVVSLPFEERKNIHGLVIGHKSKLNTSRREALGRMPFMSYYESTDTPLAGLYMAALQNGLDHIVRIHANCPVLPTWLINRAVKKYFEICEQTHYNVLSTSEGYDDAFRIDIFPFWLLADAYIYQEDREHLNLSKYITWQFKNEDDDRIPGAKYDLVFRDLKQVQVMDSIIYNLDGGYDIADILEETNGDNPKEPEEQHETE